MHACRRRTRNKAGDAGGRHVQELRKADEKSVKADLHTVMNADTAMKARSAARRFAERWGQAYPSVVACLRDDLD